MEIKGIIVKELPDSCFHGNCIFPDYCESQLTEYWECIITGEMIKDDKTRPSWCPLVVENGCVWTVGKANFAGTMIVVAHPACGWKDISDMFLSQYTFCPKCGGRIVYKE